MDTEYKIYVDEKFTHMEEKIDNVALDVNTIKTTLITKNKMKVYQDSKSGSNWSKVGIFIGSIAAIVATIAILG